MTQRNTSGNRKLPKPVMKDGKTLIPIITGHQARTFTAGDGRRVMGAYCISLQMKMSPLETSSDELEICLYYGDPKKVINQAATFLKHWYRTSNHLLAEGYPKPSGNGTMEFLTDKDFQAKYRDAQRLAARRGDELKVLGPKDDPTCFHVMRKSTRIILPSNFKA